MFHTDKPAMSRKHISERIAELDAVHDHQEILYLLNCHVFPWDIERALEFALFRTYAVPSISEKLAATGELTKRPRKRYDDTEIIMYTLTEHGYDSERGRRALRRMNQMHNRFPIQNHELLYVLTTFIYEPIRWIERFGYRSLTEQERLSFFYFYCEVGKRMNIKDIPEDYHEFEQFNIDYEREHFRYADSNRKVGEVTCDLFLGMYLPKFLYPLGRPVLYAAMDDPLLNAFGFPKPSALMRGLVRRLLRLRAHLLRFAPERKEPLLGTERQRPTYPEGYELEGIGTFGGAGVEREVGEKRT